MRRKDRELTFDQTNEVLQTNFSGILSVYDGEYPYGVPVNYVYMNHRIYFHGTSANGHRKEALQYSNKVCFTVVSKDQLVKEEYDEVYESVIVFGTCTEVESDEEKSRIMEDMMRHMGIDTSVVQKAMFACHDMQAISIFAIDIDRMSGKTSIK